MGQKVNPNGLRIGITRTWDSHWFARGNRYRLYFLEDVNIRRYIREKLHDAGISTIEIERGKDVHIIIHTSKPGVVIGKQGAAIEDLRKEMERRFSKRFRVDIREVRTPETDPEVIAETIQGQLQRRMPFRRAAKMAVEKAMQAGAIGIKVRVAGRLNGAELARTSMFKDGNVPLQTLRADIRHAKRHALTKYGTLGIQVWVYKGMVFKKVQQMQSDSLRSL